MSHLSVMGMRPAAMSSTIAYKQARGFSLIEILITMLIIAVGLMGTATLQLTGLSSNQGSYLRTQASILVYDMADRMRGNPDRAIAGDYDGFSFDANSGAEGTLNSLKSIATDCITQGGGCSRSKQSDTDLYEWAQSLMGAGSSSVALLPGAKGDVVRVIDDLFRVTVRWDDSDWDGDSGVRSITNKSFSIDFTISPNAGKRLVALEEGAA